jgi:hypothetical protein
MDSENPTFPASLQPVAPPVSPVLPKKNNLVVILLSIFLFITLLISAYLFFQVQSLTKQLAQIQVEVQATPIPSPTEASAQEGTANWKTYTNTKYGFTFKYPQDFSLTLTSQNDQGVSFAPGSYKDLDFQNLPIVSFYVYTDFTNGTGHQDFISALEGRGYSGIQNIEIKKFEGFGGTQFTSRDLQAGSGGLNINTVITLKKGILMISLSNSEKGMVDTYYQILSTFKFTN